MRFLGAFVFCLFLSSNLIGMTSFCGTDETKNPCCLDILEVDKELHTAKVEFYGRYRFSRYLRVWTSYSEQEIFLGPEIVLNEDRESSSFWRPDFSKLSGMYQEDILIEGTIISGVIDQKSVDYRVDEGLFRYVHSEFDEVTEETALLESHTCFLGK